MCSATDSYDIALSLEKIDGVHSVFDGTPIDNDIANVSDFSIDSTEIIVLSGSVKTGSNFITVDGPYQNLASVATQSGVPFKGAIMPSGDLFDIRFGPNVNFNNNTASGSRGLNISHSVGYWQVDAETSGSNLTEAMLLDYSYSSNCFYSFYQ